MFEAIGRIFSRTQAKQREAEEFCIFKAIGQIFSRAQAKQLEAQLSAAGADSSIWSGERSLGLMTILVLIVAIFGTAIIYIEPEYYGKITEFLGNYIVLPDVLVVLLLFLLIGIVTAITAWLVSQAILALYIDARKNALETVLPDFLILTAANLKAGMPLDQAMWYSAKPEFGLLSIEVKKAIKSSFSGAPLDNALDTLAKRFQSRIFARTIALIKQASATGGEVAEVLKNTAEDARNIVIMRKEAAASLVLYEIFVLFAGIVGTPFLFAVAGKLIEVFEKQKIMFPLSGSTAGGRLPSFFPGLAQGGQLTAPIITSSEFYYFSIATIMVTAIFSALIVSVIRTGTKSEGIKYFPFIFIAAYIVYVIVSSFLASVFVTLI